LTAAPADVERAAALVFTLVQDSLQWMRMFGYGAGAEESLLELWWVQMLAVQAVAAICPGGVRTAKRLQFNASERKPLTVCVGNLSPERLPDLGDLLDPYGEVEPYKFPTIAWNTRGSGCGAICADSVGLRRSSFNKWCTQCSGSTTWRRKAQIRRLGKAWSGSPHGLAWHEGRRIPVWPRTCSRCGRPFKALEEHRHRCYGCFPSRAGY
jgi:hypothetical protein